MRRSPFHLALAYLKYLLRSKSIYSIHSPFLYSLIAQIKKDRKSNLFPEIEKERLRLKKDKTLLQGHDFGAGTDAELTVSRIARNSLKRPNEARILYSIAQHLKSERILELGTSLGITTSYLAKAGTEVLSLEGNSAVLDQAKSVFENLGIGNIRTKEGNIDQTLYEALNSMAKPDFVFIDANHKKEATIDYFFRLLPICMNNTVLIFDDIHWSEEMNEAWNYIKSNEKVIVSIDLFHFGLVFFRKELSKQDFTIRI
ncbi:MAG: class I SAM-dependent methyltransferase [Bacteroidota bacterium]